MPAVAELVQPFRPFVGRLDRGRPAAVLCHSDCDGLAAGAILAKSLDRAGHTISLEVTGKGGSTWDDASRRQLGRHSPQALIVADLGCRAEPVLPGVPTLFVDHHRPEGVPPGATLVTGYGTDPTPTSGLLAWECGKLIADVSDLDWVAAVSVLGDVGDPAPFPELADVRTRHKITPLRDATSLLNTARRSAAGDTTPALRLLMKAGGPKEVKVRSACQVHPMVVSIWKTRLPDRIVMVANTGYLPGRVNFTARSNLDVNLIDFLKAHAPPEPGEYYGHGHGHDKATGGACRSPSGTCSSAGWGSAQRRRCRRD